MHLPDDFHMNMRRSMQAIRDHVRLPLMLLFTALLTAFTAMVGQCCATPKIIFYACCLASSASIAYIWLWQFKHLAPGQLTPKQDARLDITCQASDATYDCRSFTTATDLPTEWDNILSPEQLFLSRSYLRALEQAPPPNVENRYVLIQRDNKPVATAYFQLLTLNGEAVGGAVDGKKIHQLLQPLSYLKGEDAESSPIRMLLCGNALGSGEFGFHYTDDLAPEDAFNVLNQVMKALHKHESANGSIPLLAIKDYGDTQPGHKQILPAAGYHRLHAEPAMIVHLQDNWKTMDDYMAAMSSKYRKRVRNARKRGAALVRQRLSSDEIIQHKERIQELFDDVIKNSTFHLTTLHVDTFARMKDELGDNFIFTAYMLEDSILGFSVTYITGDDCEAHLVGMDYERNIDLCLYQNMLYDFVEMGIEHDCQRVHMGRTALEIKSTVGAEPEELSFYIRHPNRLYNAFLGLFLSVVPTTEWTQRRPFKD